MRIARLNDPKVAAPMTMLMALVIVAAASTARAQTTTAKVAIANPVRIFGELKQTKDLIADMANKNKTLEATRVKKQGDIQDLQQRRDTLKSDSPQWAQLNEQLLQQKIEFQNWFQYNQASIQQQQKLQIKMLYDKIVTSIQKVAVQRGIDLVFAEQRPDFNFDDVNIDQLRAALAQRNILYNSDSVDISNLVIAAMDSDYSAGK